ncbi:MAG: phage tail protein [Burkholderiaceae bacterium]|nr:phage tail protein [Burkholderiaceae bacterium]
MGQLVEFAFGWAPRGFMLCNGATLQISQNTALFSLIGTLYGGDGVTAFNLPNKPGYCICIQGIYPSRG